MPDGWLYLTADQLAILLYVSRSKVWDWNSSGRIPAPALRIGKVVRWYRPDITDWTKRGCPSRDRWLEMRKESPDPDGGGK